MARGTPFFCFFVGEGLGVLRGRSVNGPLLQSLWSPDFLIPLSGENPETKATAAAFSQSFRPLRYFMHIFATFQPKTKKNALFW
ncbi:hypothetical protein [Paenibacillus crassostreae]|nr:hypothetical protein [Paenibacillus crassostreae]AOZ91380.1 hypothetical protein LPB68_03595 [Paenibacillus crassostreae]